MSEAKEHTPLLSLEVSPEKPAISALLPDNKVLAKLYGEPLFNIPKDLYIPPHALEVFLEAFEGPLDLLLYLIRKQNFNILDIPLAEVTRQYLHYVEQIREHNLELASDYLLMAAMLIEIKSRMLLPVKPSESALEVEDPRAELVRRLIEYEQIKIAAQKIDALPVVGIDFFTLQVGFDQNSIIPYASPQVSDLLEAWEYMIRRAKLVSHHLISPEQLSVREHMSLILRKLQGYSFLEFYELFDPSKGSGVMVVSFIAILELAREGLLEVTQAQAYAPVYCRLTYQPMQ